MRFVVKAIFFAIKFYRKIHFHGKFITEFYYFFFLLSNMSPWMNKFLFTEHNPPPSFNKTGKVTVFRIVSSKVFMP